MFTRKFKIIVWCIVLLMASSCYDKNPLLKTKTPQIIRNPIGKAATELDNRIWAVFQDRNEHYWFGSNGNGLFYFDGKDLINYTSEDGLIDNTIRSVQEDSTGNLFFETPEGVSKFDGKSFTTIPLSNSSPNDWHMEADDLWFNCNGSPNDIYRYDGEQLIELKLPRKDLNVAFGRKITGLGFQNMNSSPYSVFGIDKDKAGNLWIGTVTAGAFRYNGHSFLWFPEKDLTILEDGRVPGVRSMLEDKDGNFWLSNFISKYKIIESDSSSTYEKLEGTDMSNGDFDDLLPYFNSGLSDTHGNLWMTSYSGTVWKYDGKNFTTFSVKDNFTEALITTIYEDKKGQLWLGTNNTGVYSFNGETFERFVP